MKLNKHQQFYKQRFDNQKHHIYKFTPPFVYHKSTNKKVKLYQQYIGAEIISSTNASNIRPSINKLAGLDILIHINDVPCLIVCGANGIGGIHIGYSKKSKTLPESISLHGNKIKCTKLILNNGTIEFYNDIYDFEPELNNIVQEYNIQEQEISEELQFQLDTILPNTQYYLPVYQRAIQIQNKINSLREEQKNLTVLRILRIVAGL